MLFWPVPIGPVEGAGPQVLFVRLPNLNEASDALTQGAEKIEKQNFEDVSTEDALAGKEDRPEVLTRSLRRNPGGLTRSERALDKVSSASVLADTPGSIDDASAVPSAPTSNFSEGLAMYRIALAAETVRAWKDAPDVRIPGDGERVVLAVALGVAGEAKVSVEESSGQALLDQLALSAMTRAVHRVPIPELAGNRNVSLTLQIIVGPQGAGL